MMKPVLGELVPTGGGDPIPLVRTMMKVGRRESCDICLQFPNVSGKHCELTFKEGLWILRDLDSTNGVKINDDRLDCGAKRVLHNGDVVTPQPTMRYSPASKASQSFLLNASWMKWSSIRKV